MGLTGLCPIEQRSPVKKPHCRGAINSQAERHVFEKAVPLRHNPQAYRQSARIPTCWPPPVDFDTALDVFSGFELQSHGRKGATKMSENQYDAPAMEVVEFGKEDAVCTASSEGGQIEEPF